MDGHSISKILDALDKAKKMKSRSSIIIAHTIKGKGVSYMENRYEWHEKAPGREEYEIALRELEV